MSRPREQLADFVLGTLSEGEAQSVRAHLEGCDTCRGEVRRLQGALYALPEALLLETSPASAWAGLQARLAPPRPPGKQVNRRQPVWAWERLALAASLLLLAGCLVWGFDTWGDLRRVESDQRVLTAWMTNPELTLLPVESPAGVPPGVLCIYPDGRALLVQKAPPPPGRVYQVWGVDHGRRVSLGTTTTRLARFLYAGLGRVEVSLEPAGGSSRPTELVGQVPLS